MCVWLISLRMGLRGDKGLSSAHREQTSATSSECLALNSQAGDDSCAEAVSIWKKEYSAGIIIVVVFSAPKRSSHGSLDPRHFYWCLSYTPTKTPSEHLAEVIIWCKAQICHELGICLYHIAAVDRSELLYDRSVVRPLVGSRIAVQ